MADNFKDIASSTQDKINELKEAKDKVFTTKNRNIVFVALLIVGLLAASVVAMQIITGAVALGFAAVVGVGLFFIFKNFDKLDPLVAQKLNNYILSKQIEEARKNNIIQLQNTVLARKQRLKEGRKARDEMGGYVQKLEQKVRASDPNSDPYHKQKVEMFDKIKSAYEANQAMLTRAAQANKEFEMQVEHYKDMEAFANIAGKATKAIKTDDLENMLSLAAFDSIDDQFNTAMVELEGSVADYAVDNEL